MPPLPNNWQRLMVPGIVAIVAAGAAAFWYFADSERKREEPVVTISVPQKKTAPKIESSPGQAGNEIKPGPPEIKANQAKIGAGATGIVAGFKPYASEVERETYLDGVVNSPEASAGLNVELKKNSVLPTDVSGKFSERSRYRLNVSGTWADVNKYIQRLQRPEEFRFVRRIAMVSKPAEGVDTEPVAEAQLDLEKWWVKPRENGYGEGNPLTPDQQNFLKRVSNVEHLPIELFNHAMTPLFAADSQVRITSMEAERDYKGTQERVMLAIKGESGASNAQPILKYTTSLRRTDGLKELKWEASPHTATSGGGIQFKVSGTLMIDENGESK